MKKLTLLVIGIAGLLAIPSCGNYGEYGDYGEGLSEDIQNIIPDDLIKTVKDLGMKIYEGNTPPSVNGTFLATPLVLKKSNIADDEIGEEYDDLIFTLKNYNSEAKTISLEADWGGEISNSVRSFISGTGNNFSVFVEVTVTDGSAACKSVDIYSGTLTSTGIKNFYYSFIITEDYGDPYDEWAEIGEARVFYDKDGSTPKTGTPKSALIANPIPKKEGRK
jgi:hypothetical protein